MLFLLSNKVVLDNKFNNKIKKQKFKIKLDKINENEELNFNFHKNNLNGFNQYKIYDLKQFYYYIINFFKHHIYYYKND